MRTTVRLEKLDDEQENLLLKAVREILSELIRRADKKLTTEIQNAGHNTKWVDHAQSRYDALTDVKKAFVAVPDRDGVPGG